MKIYYTAKDIEEMADKGIQQLEVGPGITLTDFARETAQQLNIALVDGSRQATPPAQPALPRSATRSSGKYNKPSGCMHGSASLPTAPAGQATEGANSQTVNRLIDMMGKVIKRGG